MTNYRELLKLHSLGFSKTEIAASCKCPRNTVVAMLQWAANCGLKWPLPEGMTDKQLSERLFPVSASKLVYKMTACSVGNGVANLLRGHCLRFIP